MKSFLRRAAFVAPVLAVLALAGALYSGIPYRARAANTEQNFDARSQLRFIRCRTTFLAGATTASQVGLHMCAAPGSGKVVDVILSQSAVGVGGTSWTALVKKKGTDVCTTDGVKSLAAGANTSMNIGAGSPDFVSLAAGTGETAPVLKTDATVTVAKGDTFTLDLTNTGSYSTGYTGSVEVLILPDF